ETGARFDDVVTRKLESGVGEVVSQPESLLNEVLRAHVGADNCTKRVIDALNARLIRARIPAEVGIISLRFVEEWSHEIIVLELRDRHSLVIVDRFRIRLISAEVANVCFTTIAEAQLSRRSVVDRVVNLPEP